MELYKCVSSLPPGFESLLRWHRGVCWYEKQMKLDEKEKWKLIWNERECKSEKESSGNQKEKVFHSCLSRCCVRGVHWVLVVTKASSSLPAEPPLVSGLCESDVMKQQQAEQLIVQFRCRVSSWGLTCAQHPEQGALKLLGLFSSCHVFITFLIMFDPKPRLFESLCTVCRMIILSVRH